MTTEIMKPSLSSDSTAITTSAESEESTKTSPSSSAATSLTASSASAPKDGDGESICRDFLRNVCTRGSSCRYSHKSNGSEYDKVLQEKILFCHDFQNRQCTRADNCKFLHCRREDEEQYKKNGYLPPILREQALTKGIGPDRSTLFGGRPVCKDYLKGECYRRKMCRFRHLTRMQYDMEMGGYGNGGPSYQNERQRPAKRRWNEFDDDYNYANDYAYDEYNNSSGNSSANYEADMVRQENVLLKQRVEELKKQINDLTTTNEFLLDQNAQLRLGCKQPPQLAPAPGQQPTPVSLDQPPISMAPTLQQSAITIDATMVMPASSLPSSMAHMEAQPTVSMPVHALAPTVSGPPPGPPAMGQHPTQRENVAVHESRLVSYPLPTAARPM